MHHKDVCLTTWCAVVPGPSSSSPRPGAAVQSSARFLCVACLASAAAVTPGTGRWRAAKCASTGCVVDAQAPTCDTLHTHTQTYFTADSYPFIYPSNIWTTYSTQCHAEPGLYRKGREGQSRQGTKPVTHTHSHSLELHQCMSLH